MNLPFDNSYARLPGTFYVRQDPVPVQAPRMVRLNAALAREIGLDPDTLDAEVLAGNKLAEGATPIATAYAGHQFGGFVPQLGDGRAHLLGEVVGPDGIRRDIQLKGSGRTAFSRNGDGRAVIGAVLREYIVSEAMAALGIPTTRSLAAVETGQRVQRECAFPGGILTRVAQSHLRVGSFQFHAARRDRASLQSLTDYAIARHYPEAAGADNPALDLLRGVAERQARLIAQWMGVGFVHGVMNTDNMAISGETIDYGPCAFLESYHPETVFSSIDHFGRYAFANQPKVAHWNLAQLAGALLPLIDADAEKATELAIAVLDQFPDRFGDQFFKVFSAKLGLDGAQDDRKLIETLLTALALNKVDFTLFFRRLTQWAAGAQPEISALFAEPAAWGELETGLSERWSLQGGADLARMRAANPVYIARNHRVEQAIQAANDGDYAPFHRLVDLLERPFDDQPDRADYDNPARPDEVVHVTYCGT